MTLLERFPDVKLEFPGFVYDMVAKGYAQGYAQGCGRALSRILEHRGIGLSAEQRRTIESCEDRAVLDAWIDRVLAVTSADELFG